MKKVFVYNDLGSSEFSVKELINCFKSIYKNRVEIATINSNEIKNGFLLNETIKNVKTETENSNDEIRLVKNRLLCMGGGFDLGYMKALGTDGCDKIKEFVYSGGNYLGICAGAYFATDFVEFDLNGPLEVKGKRDLKFFNGKSIGPINKTFKYNCDDEAVSVKIELILNNSNPINIEQKNILSFNTYLNGGCYFMPYDSMEKLSNFKTIANYASNLTNQEIDDEESSKKKAIIECNIGKGKCLLSGVHFEFDTKSLDLNNKNILCNLYENLTKNNQKSNMKLFLLLENNHEPHQADGTNSSDISRRLEIHSNYNLIKYLFKNSFNF